MGKLTIVCWILQALHIYYVSCCLPSMARFHKLKQPLRLYLWAKYGSSRPPYGTLGTYVTRHTPQAHYVTNPTCRTWIHEDTCRTRIWHVSCAQDMCQNRVRHLSSRICVQHVIRHTEAWGACPITEAMGNKRSMAMCEV